MIFSAQDPPPPPIPTVTPNPPPPGALCLYAESAYTCWGWLSWHFEHFSDFGFPFFFTPKLVFQFCVHSISGCLIAILSTFHSPVLFLPAPHKMAPDVPDCALHPGGSTPNCGCRKTQHNAPSFLVLHLLDLEGDRFMLPIFSPCLTVMLFPSSVTTKCPALW